GITGFVVTDHILTKANNPDDWSVLDHVTHHANNATHGAVGDVLKGTGETIIGAAQGTAETLGGFWNFLTSR
ncbi:MAG TPA: hypothetical protein VJB16_03895, partial [archaeon]|nr:hypothetical protein [archaeon]